MAAWSFCSVYTEKTSIVLLSTEEMDMNWLKEIYGERVFEGITIADGFMKNHIEYPSVIKLGSRYPYWKCTIAFERYYQQAAPELKNSFFYVEWEIYGYLLENDWEPFSSARTAIGDGVGTGLTLYGTVNEKLFRKLRG